MKIPFRIQLEHLFRQERGTCDPFTYKMPSEKQSAFLIPIVEQGAQALQFDGATCRDACLSSCLRKEAIKMSKVPVLLEREAWLEQPAELALE